MAFGGRGGRERKRKEGNKRGVALFFESFSLFHPTHRPTTHTTMHAP